MDGADEGCVSCAVFLSAQIVDRAWPRRQRRWYSPVRRCVALALIAALFVSGRMLVGRVPLVAVALVAFNAAVFYYDSSIRAYGLAALFIVLCFAIFWRMLEEPTRWNVAAELLAVFGKLARELPKHVHSVRHRRLGSHRVRGVPALEAVRTSVGHRLCGGSVDADLRSYRARKPQRPAGDVLRNGYWHYYRDLCRSCCARKPIAAGRVAVADCGSGRFFRAGYRTLLPSRCGARELRRGACSAC